MKKRKIGEMISTLLFSGILAAELAVLLDVVSVFYGRALSVPKFAALLAVLFLAILLMPPATRRIRKTAAVVIAVAVGVPLLVAGLCWHSVSESVVYRSTDSGKAALYADRKVMVLVPHQDDDINVLGGVMEEYVKYGSEVYVVFSTNGDYYGLAETRFREALNALGNVGIPEDHVIFLGYGDQWDPDGPHLYNGAPGEVVTSMHGRTETYGTTAKGAWVEGNAYTIDNFLGDIESVILRYRPDVLYCVDYDYNIDHRALSLSFEKVMGKILKENSDYRPQIFKGYAYNTAWESEKEFYGENLISAQNVFTEPYHQTPAVYRWEERIRLPVNGESLSRSVLSAEQNVTLSAYESQGANMYGPRVFKSDKVFWQRFPESVCLTAKMEASSGDAEMLNDFMLLESDDLLKNGALPYDGVWIPEDSEKTVQVSFPEPVDLARIVLYDHPDPEKNVLNAVITFGDGTVLETGALDAGGAATRIDVERENVSFFSVKLEQTAGEAGLTEMEAFEEIPDSGLTYIKLMDEDGNFAYDYWIDPSGSQLFTLYTCGAPGAGEEAYALSCSNPVCEAVWENGRLRIRCPEGESCVVTVTSPDGALADSVFIQNPGSLERSWKMFWLRAEEWMMNLCDAKRLHERVFVCRLLQKLPGILERITG